jgi:hypothetical protein
MSLSFRISLIELPQVLMFLQLYEVNLILFSLVSLFNLDVCSFEVDWYNDSVATSKDNEAYVAGQPLFYGRPNPQAAKVTASQTIQHTITRTPPDQYVLSPPLHPGQTTRIVPREKQSGNRYTPLNPRTATSVPFLVNSNPLRMNRHQY